MTDDFLGENPLETLAELHGLLDSNPETVFREVSQVESLYEHDNDVAIGILGLLIDSAGITDHLKGLGKAINLAKGMLEQDLKQGYASRVNYDMGNAYSYLRKSSSSSTDLWDWENILLEKEILHFREALEPDEVEEIYEQELCKIYTNLGNALSGIGRYIEAIYCWDQALETDSDFSQAKGQKGIGLFHYARSHYDLGHSASLLRVAYKQITEALEGNLFPNMRDRFVNYQNKVEELFKPGELENRQDFEEYSLGDTEKEKEYQIWCLNNTLFLNSLNDITSKSIAGSDILHLGSVTSEDSNRIVSSVGFFNRLKQEYISARYLLYKGIHGEGVHFSDKEVYLENTLDYPSYSLNTEKTRTSFRIAYSLFDKIATFIQHYFDLSHIEDPGPHFDQVWYKSRGKNDLAPEFKKRENWALRGLFWLSKDLEYSNSMYVEDSLEPGAEELRSLRNKLEHEYVKLHDDLWTGSVSDKSVEDELAKSLYLSTFKEKTMKVLQKTRAGIIYLALAINEEEGRKKQDRGDAKIPLYLGKYEDEWKR